MKIKYVLFGIMIMGLTCCKKENTYPYKSYGKIIGQDYTTTPCSGGWFIEIENAKYNFDSLPANSNINLQKEALPVNVRLDWDLINTIGCTKWITIHKIAKE